MSYDQTGNLLNDTFNTYTWDAYGSPISINGSAVIYDAFGRMVENLNGGIEFVYSPVGGKPLAGMSGQSAGNVYLPLPGGAYAIYNGAGTLYQYNHPDWLGSARLFSSPSRVATPAMSYAPFGEGYAAGSSTWTQFTGSGNAWTVSVGDNLAGSLEDFMFRRYSPSQGRWISPDPAGLAAVDPMNPQSWNRYAYVLNNPLTLVDPLGLIWDGGAWCVAPESTDGLGGGGGGPASGIFEGELSLSLPTQPLDPNSPQAQAIIALLTGNWRGLLDSALGAASQDLWNMVPDPAIMDAANNSCPGCSSPNQTPQQCATDIANHWSISGLLPGAPGTGNSFWGNFIGGLLGNNVTNYTNIYNAVFNNGNPIGAYGTILGAGPGGPGSKILTSRAVGSYVSFLTAPKWILDGAIYAEAWNYCATGKY